MNDEARKSIQSVLDAVSPHLFGGADVMITLAAIAACPDSFPRIVVGIMRACPEAERSKLMIRSGRCLPMSRHAGQKEKVNEEAKTSNIIKLPKRGSRKRGDLERLALSIIEREGKLVTSHLCQEAQVTSHHASNLLTRLYKKGLITRSGSRRAYVYSRTAKQVAG